MKFVSLSTNDDIAYSLFAPLSVRVWRLLGYEAIVHVHTDGWADEFGRLVLHELSLAGARLVTVPTVAPLSVANTMRVVRLCAAAQSSLQDDDVIVTSDVDILPLRREWFYHHRRRSVISAARSGGETMHPKARRSPPRISNLVCDSR